MATKNWFITGTSRGFGREWAIAALDRGDRVAATARRTSSLAGLVDEYGDAVLPLTLDIRDRAAVTEAVRTAHEHFGRLDVIVNNAGYGLFGTVEEVSEEQARDQIDTNLFGALWVTQAALPYLREQGSGHIVQVSSIAGVSAMPNIGLYNAGKWALEGLSQALAQEVEDFGIHVTLVEPTNYETDWAGSSAVHAEPLSVYDEVRRRDAEAAANRPNPPGKPAATRNAILAVVDADKPPSRIFFGDGLVPFVTADYESRLATWREWEPVSVAAHGG
jgi:NAD(P)-dependent dehydrogenase (short-subunit alcohol dehydrogenase family)